MNILEITIILLRYNNMGVVSLEIISKLNLNKKENKKNTISAHKASPE